ncbi:hypothetical protein Y1Q_0013977 [Alligator mississippiensis]|uniref:Uncharacterized protein n=1 Tax=Alligator mississippiensis TaxID=8496 RepID=A0A151PD75_ALLMI|nr:hypothetical protein Y1Q_0013977 [Alligator mississippiensis]
MQREGQRCCRIGGNALDSVGQAMARTGKDTCSGLSINRHILLSGCGQLLKLRKFDWSGEESSSAVKADEGFRQSPAPALE